MSKYRRKRVLFVCIGNACRSPMAEAIARVDASDVIDAFSAGLAPTGFVTELTKQTLMTNGCWVEGLESKVISPKVWEQVDIIINMSGRPRELTFYEYSKVEDWKIEDPYGQDPDTHQRVFDKIRRRVAKLAQECTEEHAAVRFTERRARGRWYPTPPIPINLNGGDDATVVNISEDGLALSAPIVLSDVPLQDMHVQFLESPRPFEACCKIAWKSESQKEVGIQFVGLMEEARQHIRNWISAQTSANHLPGQADELYEKHNPSREVPSPPQWENVIPGGSTSGEVINKYGDASLFSPVAVPILTSANPPLTAPRTHARTGIWPNKWALPLRRTLARAQGSPGVPRRRSPTFLILGLLFGIISLTVVWMTIQRNARSEMITAVAQKPAVLSEAVKPLAPPPLITTPSVHNPQANKTQAQTSLVQSMPVERVDSIQDISPKDSPRPANPVKKPSPVFRVKPPSHRVETVLTRGPATNASSPVAINANISPVEKKPQQAPSSVPPTPPQLETNIARLAVPAPLPSKDVRPPEPESKAVSAAKQPATPANITGAVAVLADPYPSLRIPNGGSKKQRQGTSLQLGHLLSRVEPVYPEDAKQQGLQGTVKLHAVIDRHGSVENLQSVNGPPLLVAAAMNAVRQWRFSETLLAGQTVETEEDIDVIFRLSNPGASRK